MRARGAQRLRGWGLALRSPQLWNSRDMRCRLHSPAQRRPWGTHASLPGGVGPAWRPEVSPQMGHFQPHPPQDCRGPLTGRVAKASEIHLRGACLVVQRLRIGLLMQGTWVPSLVRGLISHFVLFLLLSRSVMSACATTWPVAR